MKFYIQNGTHRKVVDAPNHTIAVKSFLQSLIVPSEDGSETGEFAAVTIASDYDFYEDIIDANNMEQADKCRMIETASVFDKMDRKDMATWMRKQYKKYPADFRKVLRALRD